MSVRVAGYLTRFKPIGMPLMICGLALACYWPALNGSILWDDPAHIPRPELQSWAGLGRIWTEPGATQQYYPVLFSAFWLEHRLWGDQVLGYHLLNVLLHAAAGCLAAITLRRLWDAPLPPASAGSRNIRLTAAAPGSANVPARRPLPAGAEWFAAALFVVHPVCVESVAWITEQKNTLSLVFYLAAAWAYLDFATGRRWRSYALASGLFLLALGSKTVTATLPAALLVVLWWRQGTLAWKRDVAPLVPWFIAALGIGSFVAWFERNYIGAEGADFHFSLVERALLAGRVFWFYLGKVVWPTELMFFYPRWDVTSEARGWLGAGLALVAVTGTLFWLRRRTRGPLAAWLLYLGALFPFLGFFNAFYFLFSFVADHSQYLPACELILAATGGAAWLLSDAPRPLRLGSAAAGVALIALLAISSHRQSAHYRDNETLARATIARNPSAWMAHQILATTLAKEPGRHEEAMAAYREVIRLKPDHPDAHFGLGVELARLPGRTDEALAAYQSAIALRPNYAEAHNNLGAKLAALPGRASEAIRHLETALQVSPAFAEAHANLGDALTKFPERVPEALTHYEEALRLKPSLGWVHCRLAFVLSHLPGRDGDALAHYQTALTLDPRSLDAHNGLALFHAQRGRLAEARREWETVLAIDPRQESARRNLRRLDELAPR